MIQAIIEPYCPVTLASSSSMKARALGDPGPAALDFEDSI